MTPSAEEDFRIAEEAALWLQRLEREDTPQVHAEFSAWIKRGAVNLQEFLFAKAVWMELGHVDPAVRARLDAAAADAQSSVIDLSAARTPGATPVKAAAEEQVSMPTGVRAERRRGFVWLGAAAACLVAMISAVIALIATRDDAQIYATTIGDQKAIKLADGSVMHLNTASRVEVRYSQQERMLRLIEGEALFTAAKDPARPFVVLTESARIRALGTQFNVYRNNSGETRVTVLDGAVQVSETRTSAGSQNAVRLAAGDEAKVDRGARIIKDVVPNVQRAVAWRARRLMFPGAPVSQIAEEFNRYNRVQIRVEGEALRQRRMSGVFDADDPSPLIRFLSGSPEVTVVRGDHEILIRPRTPQD